MGGQTGDGLGLIFLVRLGAGLELFFTTGFLVAGFLVVVAVALAVDLAVDLAVAFAVVFAVGFAVGFTVGFALAFVVGFAVAFFVGVGDLVAAKDGLVIKESAINAISIFLNFDPI